MGITRGGRFPCIIVIFTKCGMKSVGLQSFQPTSFWMQKGGGFAYSRHVLHAKSKNTRGSQIAGVENGIVWTLIFSLVPTSIFVQSF